MLTVKVKTVDGKTELYEIEKYLISTKKLMHPAILEVTVYSQAGKKLKKIKRHFQKFYIKHKYKPETVELEQDQETPEQ